MKKIFITLFFLSTLLCALGATGSIEVGSNSGVELINNTDSGLSFRSSISEINSFDVTTERGDFTQLSIDNYTSTTKIGDPQLPMKRKIISVPLEATVSINVTSYDEKNYNLTDYGIDNQIIPAQAPVAKDKKLESLPFELNEKTYHTSGYNSNDIISYEELGIMRGMRLFVINIQPVKYDAVSNSLKIFNNINVNVNFSQSNLLETQELREKTFSPYFESAYQRFVFNYQASDLRNDLMRYPIKYIIISDRMFEAQLEPFIQWKFESGFDVIVGYTDEIGSSTSQIKSFIQQIYNSATPEDPAPSFVLFVGDVNQIPAYSGQTGGHITDLDYVKMSGNDYLPEIMYGRFSANNTAELQPQIDKTLEYETFTMADPSYLEEVVMIAGMDGSFGPTHGNGQINYGTTHYFNAAHGITSNTYLYPASGSSSSQIINNVSDGVSYVNYTAHGSPTSWADPSFTIGNINNLNNEGQYPFVVGNCCLTNKFEINECFGEAWLRAENRGSIGYIGGTNSTYWDEDYWWGVGAGPIVPTGASYAQTGLGVYDGLFHDHNEDFSDYYTSSAGMIICGNLAVVEGGSGYINYYWEIYSLMGDPSLTTYIGVPEVNIAQYPQTIFLGLDSITITAEPYSYIGLSKNGVLHGSGLVGESGTITMEILPFINPGNAKLVITKQNCEPIITEIEVIPNAGAYCVISNVEISDPDNGVIEFGETIQLTVTLENVGIENANNVSMELSINDPYITLLDATENYGLIAAGTTNSVQQGFSFEVSDNVPDNYDFTLDAIIVADEAEWTSMINLTAFNAEIIIDGILVDDGSNGRLDPGETADVILTLLNNGGAAATNIETTLNTLSEYITINNDFDLVDFIEAGDTQTVSFNLSAAGDTPIGEVVNFSLDIVADNNYSTIEELALTVGLCLEDFETGDFSNYEWEFGGNADWTISDDSYEGDYSAKSGTISHNQESELIFEVDVLVAGEISFFRRVSSENNYDYLRFYVDNNVIGEWCGDVIWSEFSYPVSAGTHTFRWSYEKDGSVSSGSDCAWIDYIIFPSISVVAIPQVVIEPTFLNSEIPQNTIETQTLEIGNIGNAPLTFEIAIEETENINRARKTSAKDLRTDWLSTETTSGTVMVGNTIDIEFEFSATDLEPGTYNTNIIITTNDPVTPTLTIPAQLVVLDPPFASVTISSANVQLNEEFEININTTELVEDDGIIAYQFVLNYDADIISYSNYSLDGTIAEGGMVSINTATAGVLQIGYMSINAIIGSGSILDLSFVANANGETSLDGSDFLFNTTMIPVESGIVVVGDDVMYGDVDGNGIIQAFDASMALQIAVGLITPTPVQLIVADVDGNGSIQAFDASLILQYAVGLITIFPVEERTKYVSPLADVEISVENNELVFTAAGDLYGFEIEVLEGITLGKSNSSLLMESNENKVAVASADIISGEFLRIPFTTKKDSDASIKLVINTEISSETINYNILSNGSIVNFIDEFSGNYPNPFNPTTSFMFSVKNANTDVVINVYNVKGKFVKTVCNQKFNTGKHCTNWNGKDSQGNNVGSGVYFYNVKIGDKSSNHKMLLLK